MFTYYINTGTNSGALSESRGEKMENNIYKKMKKIVFIFALISFLISFIFHATKAEIHIYEKDGLTITSTAPNSGFVYKKFGTYDLEKGDLTMVIVGLDLSDVQWWDPMPPTTEGNKKGVVVLFGGIGGNGIPDFANNSNWCQVFSNVSAGAVNWQNITIPNREGSGYTSYQFDAYYIDLNGTIHKANGTHYKPEKWKGEHHDESVYEKFDLFLHWRKNGTIYQFYSLVLMHRSSATDKGYSGQWNVALNNVDNVTKAWINLTFHNPINISNVNYSSFSPFIAVKSLPTGAAKLDTISWDMVYINYTGTPSIIWVDDDWKGKNLGDAVNGHTFGYDAFANIQDAINAYKSSYFGVGDPSHFECKIIVNSGIYHENLVINKSVTLIGKANTTIIDGDGSICLLINGSGLTETLNIFIEGFSFKNSTDYIIKAIDIPNGSAIRFRNNKVINGDVYGWYSKDSHSELYIYNNTFSNIWHAIHLEKWTGKVKIFDNEFTQLHKHPVGHSPPVGIACLNYGNSSIIPDKHIIYRNCFYNFNDSGTAIYVSGGISGKSPAKYKNMEINYNTIGAKKGIYLLNFAPNVSSSSEGGIYDSIILNNSISSSQACIIIEGKCTNISIVGNNFSGAGDGIKLLAKNEHEATNIKVHFNNFATSLSYGINNAVSSQVNATKNWWGDDSGPTHSSNPGGTGCNINGSVLFSSWLSAEYDYPHCYLAFVKGEKTIDATSQTNTILSLNSSAFNSIIIGKYKNTPTGHFDTGMYAVGSAIEIIVEDISLIQWPANVTMYYTSQDIANASIGEEFLQGIAYLSPAGIWKIYNNGWANTSDVNNYSGYCWAIIDHFSPITIYACTIPTTFVIFEPAYRSNYIDSSTEIIIAGKGVDYIINFSISGPFASLFFWNGHYYSCNGTWYQGNKNMDIVLRIMTPELEAVEGQYILKYYAMDSFGMKQSMQQQVLIVDATSPNTTAAVSGGAGNNGWFISNVTINLTAYDEMSGVSITRWRINENAWQIGVTATISQEGTVIFTYQSVDNVGNYEEEHSIEIKIDKSPPTVSHVFIPFAPENEWYVSRVKIRLFANDMLSGVAAICYQLDGGEWKIYEKEIIVEEDGQHILKYYAVDIAGNIGSTFSAAFAIDRSSPIVSILKPKNALYLFNRRILSLPLTIIVGKIDIEVEAIDNISGVERIGFYIDDEMKTIVYQPPYQWLWDEAVIGKHTIKVIAYDEAGNIASDERETWILNM